MTVALSSWSTSKFVFVVESLIFRSSTPKGNEKITALKACLPALRGCQKHSHVKMKRPSTCCRSDPSSRLITWSVTESHQLPHAWRSIRWFLPAETRYEYSRYITAESVFGRVFVPSPGEVSIVCSCCIVDHELARFMGTAVNGIIHPYYKPGCNYNTRS